MARTPKLLSIEALDAMPLASLPDTLAELSALLARGALRLREAAAKATDDECEAFDVDEAAKRLNVSTDTLRDRGEAWGVALVLTTDKNGKPTRVVYPRARLRAFLEAGHGLRANSHRAA